MNFSLCVSPNHFFEKLPNHGNSFSIQNHSPGAATLHLPLLVISLYEIRFDNNMVVLYIGGMQLQVYNYHL